MSLTNSQLQSRAQQIITVKSVLEEVIFDICEREKCFLLINAINEFCLDLILHGAHPKPYYVSQKTEKNGLEAGLILKSMNRKRSNLQEDFRYSNIESLDISKFIKSKEEVLCYKEVPVTADLDIVGIARQVELQDFHIHFEKEIGYFTVSDKAIIKHINNSFIERVFIEFGHRIFFNIIQHGPLNCCPSITVHDLNFPLCVYGPERYKKTLGVHKSDMKNNMKSFLDYGKILQEHEYSMMFPKSWIEK